jgi:ankyrin repeat protein
MMNGKITNRTVMFFLLSVLLAGCFGPKTPLGKAVQRNDAEEVNELLAQGVDPCEEVGGHASFVWAQGNEPLKRDLINTKLYRVLLDAAYQRVLDGKKCENILFYAARIGNAEMIKQLIARGEKPDDGQESWETSPLGIAAYYGHEDAVRALIEGGANVDIRIDDLERSYIRSVVLGSKSSYQRELDALKMLRKYKEKQK